MEKEGVSQALFLAIILAIIYGVLFSQPIDSPTGFTHKAGHGGGGGGGGPPPPSPEPSPTPSAPSTATETATGEGPPPVKVIPENPKDGDTIKRGILTILVKGYEGDLLDPNLDFTAESELFGKIELENNFEFRGQGIYGAKVKLGKNITKEQYAIVIKGESSRRFDEERILVNVDPTIYINTNIEEHYFKGRRIRFTGDLKYFNKEPAGNVTVLLRISALDFLLDKVIPSDPDGKFIDSYLISFAEPDGKWNIGMIAADENENEGNAELSTRVSTPERVAFYIVTFLSPLKDAEYKRGDIVPITVEIKEEDTPIENASVDFRNPKAEIINLNEIRAGTYTAEYKISPDDPLGRWHIAVQSVKTQYGATRAGGNKIAVNIRPAAINLDLLRPTTSKFFIGLKTEIRAKLSYVDGTKVENANVMVKISNETILLAEYGPGLYTASYLFADKDVGTQSLQLIATDIYGNGVTTAPKAIDVEQIGKYELKLRLFYYNILLRFWYLWILGIVLIVIVTSPIWHLAQLKASLNKTIEEERRVLEMEKDTQHKYFKEHVMSRGDYDKFMLKYRERTSDLKEKKIKLEKALKKFWPIRKV
mgnify:CR=1 FL=1